MPLLDPFLGESRPARMERARLLDNPDRAWMIAELGLVALERGQSAAALQRLEEASAHGLTPDSVAAISADAAWAPLRGDARFAQLIPGSGSPASK